MDKEPTPRDALASSFRVRGGRLGDSTAGLTEIRPNSGLMAERRTFWLIQENIHSETKGRDYEKKR